MGLIGWIKKEIESTSRQRRQSAPPPIQNLQFQDPAYRRAIEKFREYRHSGRFERLNETKNTSTVTQSDITATNNNKTIDSVSITDVEIQAYERERLKSHRKHNSHKHDSNKTDAIYSNCNPEEVGRNKRFSLPIIRDKIDSTISNNGRNKISKKLQPTSTIDEIEEFEQNHCNRIEDESFGNSITTPPSKFYRNNSDPYDSTAKKTVDSAQKPTPKRLMGKNMLRRNKGKAPQPPTVKRENRGDAGTESTVNFYNGNFKRYDVSTASVDDEFVISSKAYKGRMRKEHPENINSVGESASSGSLSSDTINEKNLIKNRRLSPLNYQTVINKHGEEVEYALPYNERDSTLDLPPLPEAPIPNVSQHQISTQFDQLIDQNFKFLNSKLDFLNSQIDDGEDAQKAIQSIEQISILNRPNVQVTDLDKSNECGLAFPMQTGDIMKDLDALSKWTQNFEKNDRNTSPMLQYLAAQKDVKIFNACDIKYKAGSLRNSFSTPLEFSNGYFHQTPITLRSTLPNNYNISNFADNGCKHEFEILCQVKHLSIVTLMGISFDKDLRVTSLIMEPFDYTLNHYLHQMDKFYNIQQTVSIIHQIASATQYLNECGFIHSNISSHAVLIRENPFAVKLSSFELVTEILPREMTGKFYEMQKINVDMDIYNLDITSDHVTAEKYGKLSKQHFYNRTSLPISRFEEDVVEDDEEYKLTYSIAYRRMYSMHYYQAPELLVPTNNSSIKYVKPTIQSDVYGLGLMLWELINRVVPYVIYNHDELISGLIKGKVQLPVLDKSSIIFKEIFESCLHADIKNRLPTVSKFITMLEDLQLLGYEKDKIEVLEIIEPSHEHKTEKNIKNSDQRDKLREKIYFSKTEINDPQRRFENALTTENLIDMGLRDTSQKISESVQSSEIEANMASFSHQAPGILQDDALDRIRKTVESQRNFTPKKPSRKRDDEHEHSKNSTMFQSFFGFDRLQTPKVDKDVIYERTSTLKKRLKAGTSTGNKKSVKGLFDEKIEKPEEKQENIDEKKILREQFEKMNDELNLIISNYDKSDFMQEIVKEIKDRGKTKNDNGLSTFLNKAIQDNNLSRSFEELPINDKEPEFVGIKRSESDACGSNLHRYSSNESFSLPHTPIARQNMIRRNAWLSDNYRPNSSTHISDEIAKRSIKFTNSSPLNDSKSQNLKQYNVNIKIHHNDLDGHTTPKSTNLNQSQSNSSSVKIKLYNSASKLSPIVKINNIDLNKTSYTEDINKKYYPLMPEMLSDAIQNKRDRSFMQTTQYEEEHNKINHEKSLEIIESQELANKNDEDSDYEIEEKVIIPLPMSVRDTVKLIETTYNPNSKLDMFKHHSSVNHDDGYKCEKICEETQTDECDFPALIKEGCVDDGTECLTQASESIQKLENLQSNNDAPKVKRLENLVNQSTTSTQTPKKITTKVTLNLKKITGRSSDVSHLKHVQEQVLNNTEILKRFQAHFRAKESSLANKNDQISASCSSLVSKECNQEMVSKNGGHNKYFCRNCGFTMIPAEILQKIQSSGRLSIASSITDGLQSIKYDESLQSLAAIRKCQQLVETRSTEDLYIDDDFCQGISHSLAANMELLPPPDFFDSIDFNILSAEIFHTQEHDFDDTLKDDDENIEQIEGNEKHDEKEINKSHNESLHVDDVVPICDEKNDEIMKQDEPKV
ncbi:putative leucine-rich repeat-containing protein DDB_G0290503 [Chironomus tepperi]|uniref:putative leucine-rich repeat-containing protein DDB_G0290503 n=1 Tax=Chironomus tepperi TaxID=113505 RepID=UPI00391FA376